LDEQQPYTWAFMALIGLYLFSALLLSGLRENSDRLTPAGRRGGADRAADGGMRSLLKRPAFVAAVLAGVVGQGVMTYVMTATPVSMNVAQDFSLQLTSEVVRAHVIAMYLPSLITPWLIARLGIPRMMLIGLVALATTVGVGLAGHHLMHYWFAMVLLGVGWNFLFVSGTSLLVQTYEPQERFHAQALNDFSVFGASATASLCAGTVLYTFGWNTLLMSALPALAVMLGVLLWWRAMTPAPSGA
jgi:cyanate permease